MLLQVAGQQGKYMAKMVTRSQAMACQPLPQDVRPFKYGHKGSLAYVGGDKAVMDVPGIQPITGFAAGLLWKGVPPLSVLLGIC